MSGSLTVAADAAVCHLPAPFPLRRGSVLPDPVLCFELSGPPGAPVVAVLGGISAGRRPAAWWPGVDFGQRRVLSFDWLGGRQADPTCPAVTPDDQAAALVVLLDHLQIPALHALVGASYGGMVALAFAASFPERVARLAVLAAAHEPHPLGTAFRTVQRGILDLAGAGRERDGVALARALAMATYRGADELARRFATAPVADYLQARGRAFAADFPAHAYRRLSQSIDLHRIEPERVRVPAWLCSFAGDQLVPPAQVAALAARLPFLRGHTVIATACGHDGFLVETDAVSAFLREVLS